jgi:asparagine synthase (glutamine-hydrolysing)
MYRYIALAWNPAAEGATEAASRVQACVRRMLPDFAPCFDLPGLQVLLRPTDSEGRTVPVVNHQGVILGQMFLRGGPSRGPISSVRPLDGDLFSSKVVRTRGRSLIEECWGSYVAFLRLQNDNASLVLRSPMSGLPCFRARIEDLYIFFSSVEDFTSLHLTRLTVDWQLVAAQATNGDYLTSATAIKEITEVQAGESVFISGRGISTSRYWDPREISRRPQIENFETASQLLREATQESIDGWVSRYPTAILLLSGGLDSSIVLGCMTRSPRRPAITCLTYYSDQVGDERRYARSVAQKLEVDLLELLRSQYVSLETILGCSRTSRPLLSFSAFDRYSRDLAVAKLHGASAIFDGELGDNVFGGGVGHEVADYLQIHGMGIAAFRVAADYALRAKISGWKALRIGFQERRETNRQPHWSIFKYIEAAGYDAATNGLISRDALESYKAMQSQYIHPWFLEMDGVPLGRFSVIYGLFMMTSALSEIPFAFGSQSDPALISPLASQPLVELSLQLASFLHIRGGRQRAVARDAFSDLLPPFVTNRVGKGTNMHWLHTLVSAQRPFLEETLLDGLMVRAGILDRKKLESVLSPTVSSTKVGVLDVIRMLYIEAWLRRWDYGTLRAVA